MLLTDWEQLKSQGTPLRELAHTRIEHKTFCKESLAPVHQVP
jgi:hypothetical protein